MRPIVILAMPRSGSSMTAGLFSRHGVWFGECRPGDSVNAKGYFENTAIKQEMIRRWGKLTLARGVTEFEKEPVCEPQVDFFDRVLQIIRSEGYSDGPWGYKMSALYKPAWDCFNPYYVGVKRIRVKDANLGRQTMMGTKNPEHVQRMVDKHHAVIDQCDVIVRTDELIAGNYGSLQDAMEYCGLKMDRRIVADFVDPSLWHYKNSQTTTT